MKRLNDEDRKELELADRMSEMMNTVGWKAYVQIVEGHMKSSEMIAMDTVKSVDEAIGQNAHKGAVKAFRLCLSLPKGMVSVADDLRARSMKDDEE